MQYVYVKTTENKIKFLKKKQTKKNCFLAIGRVFLSKRTVGTQPVPVLYMGCC